MCITVISVDLTDSKMSPGGRGHQRLLTGLKSRLQLKTDFLLAHHPGACDAVHRWLTFPVAVVFTVTLCPAGGGASLQALLSRCVWTEHRPVVSKRALTQLSCPVLRPGQQSCDPHSFLEWLGAVDAHISWWAGHAPRRCLSLVALLSFSLSTLVL